MAEIEAVIQAYQFMELLAPGELKIRPTDCMTFADLTAQKSWLPQNLFDTRLAQVPAGMLLPVHLGVFDGEQLHAAVSRYLQAHHAPTLPEANPEDAERFFAALTVYVDPVAGELVDADQPAGFEVPLLAVFLQRYFDDVPQPTALSAARQQLQKRLQQEWQVIHALPTASDFDALLSRLHALATKSLAHLLPLAPSGPAFGQVLALGQPVRKPETSSSMFIGDLGRVLKSAQSMNFADQAATARVARFLNGQGEHIDLEQRDQAVYFDLLKPERFPLGRWPSPYALSVMQQVAVNVALSGADGEPDAIRTVNGPPGTGKTTLLKDIFADMTVQQARVMVRKYRYLKPAAALSAKTQAGVKEVLWGLDAELAAFGIVVASTNNAAVENISKELPQRDPALADVDYYRQAYADTYAVPVDSVWGAYSAAGGRKDNVKQLHALIKAIGKAEAPADDWESACAAFAALDADLQARRAELETLAESTDPARWARIQDAATAQGVEANFAHWWHQDNANFQQATLWFDNQYRRDQGRLFALAMRVRKAFIEALKQAQPTLFDDVLAAAGDYKVANAQFAQTFALMQLAVPVISTTFAAAQSFMRRLGADSLPHLFIDEAGQALPAQALGLIWRARHVMAVGDPYQIEPVQPMPASLRLLCAGAFAVDYALCDDAASVQRLGDAASVFGATVDGDWIGMPLWVHRRCLNPMFAIANRISYHDKMVLGVPDKPGVAAWFDVQGQASVRQFVPAQRNFLQEALAARLAAEPKLTLADIYVITPFKRVQEALRQLTLPDVDAATLAAWCQSNIGTVHTFQGKEAAVVFFVLGCDEQTKAGIAWATRSANMLNVAVTRAKKEFYIIGDQKLFGGADYLKDALSLMGDNATPAWAQALCGEEADWIVVAANEWAPDPNPKGISYTYVTFQHADDEPVKAHCNNQTGKWYQLPAAFSPEAATALLKEWQGRYL